MLKFAVGELPEKPTPALVPDVEDEEDVPSIAEVTGATAHTSSVESLNFMLTWTSSVYQPRADDELSTIAAGCLFDAETVVLLRSTVRYLRLTLVSDCNVNAARKVITGCWPSRLPLESLQLVFSYVTSSLQE